MADTEEVEIPDSDELPDDDGTEADDEPHGHPHTPGYPAHRHTGDGITYDAAQVYQAGGLDLFDADRHDSDSAQADDLERERASLA